VVIERQREDLTQQIVRLEDELFHIRGETDILNRDLKGRIEQLSEERTRLARARGDLSTVRGEFSTSRRESQFQNSTEKELVAAQQRLTAEMERLMAQNPMRRRPADSA